jgi:ribosomal protein S18 acetylase RimI-like enzyme
MGIEIESLTRGSVISLAEHFRRYRRESGIDGVYFMPFTPDDPEGPQGANIEQTFWPLDRPGWQRWFVARDSESGMIFGHVDLKSDSMKSGLHWCHLAIGIEAPYRGRGLGKMLMAQAINFARDQGGLSWIELRVFANNVPALSLYRNLGFEKIGVLRDRFRLHGQSIDDIIMVLNVQQAAVDMGVWQKR